MSVDAYASLPAHLLKQSPMMDGLADVNQSVPLPPLNNLPQWSRINTLDKARYPKQFRRDKLQPLHPSNNQSMEDDEEGGDMSERDLELVESVNPQQRVIHLERSIAFLRAQHHEVLTSLHTEVEKLKRRNKELQFEMIIVQRENQPLDTTAPPIESEAVSRSAKHRHSNASAKSKTRVHKEVHSAQQSPRDVEIANNTTASKAAANKEHEVKMLYMEEELKELKKNLRDEKKRNSYLSHLLDQTKKSHVQTQNENLLDDAPALQPVPPNVIHQQQSALPYGATLSPLQVHLVSQPPRPPTMAEVEVIMKHLMTVNDRQSHELNRVKSDLKDVLYSHKWTPDAYLLAKAYVSDEKPPDGATKLPHIPRPPPTRKMPDIAYIQNSESLSLPALKQTMGNKAVERRKRTQILQKARFRKEVLQ